MDIRAASFNKCVVEGILASNQFDIKEVNSLESLKTIFFVTEEYPVVEEVIKAGDVEGIKTFSENQPRTGKYLDVMMFKDQHQNKYIVAVYDSNALEQDPQVIEIYQLK